MYLKLRYRFCFDKKLNLDTPTTYNEKLQWLKLYNRRPEYTKMVDKYSVKFLVADLIGEEHVIPTLAHWDCVDEIEWDKLPDHFVLKTTHDSGGIVICKNKASFNKKRAIRVLDYALKHDNYSVTKEWPYKNVHRRIIAEQYMEDEFGELRDYKFLCFNGEPKIMFVATGRNNDRDGVKFDYFDMDFNHLPLQQTHPCSNEKINRPKTFDEMKKIAEILSKGLPHVRIDLYDVKGKIYFGEMTFFHCSGFAPFIPEKWDYELGSWIHLPSPTA